MVEKVQNQNIPKTPEQYQKQVNKRSIIGSVIGVSVGLVASIALSKKAMPIKDIFVKNDLKASAKNIYDFAKVDYEGFKGFLSMTAQAAGAAFGSLLGALSVKAPDSEQAKKDNKAKLKEAIFMTNNVIIPTACVKTIEYLYDKNINTIETGKKLKDFRKSKGISTKGLDASKLQIFMTNKYLKTLGIALGLIGGMMTSLSVTNTINNKYIEKEDSKDKKMRPLDFIYHVDDIIPIIISSKNPICDKLPIDRILPLIYGYMGSKVGVESAQD